MWRGIDEKMGRASKGARPFVMPGIREQFVGISFGRQEKGVK